MTPEILVDGLKVPESPRWWDGKLWFSDIAGGKIATLDLDSGAVATVATIEGSPAGLGRLTDGGIIFAETRSQTVRRLDENGSATLFANLGGLAVHDLNDLLSDARGWSYVGSWGHDFGAGEPFAPAPLVRVDDRGVASIVAENLAFPNGMVVTPDGATLLVAESLGNRITSFAIDDQGALRDRTIWADVGAAMPDGIALDEEGGLWFADVFACAFVRIERGGRETHRITTPGRWALAPAFAGSDRRTLVLMTCETDMERRARGDMIGRIEAVPLDVPGVK